MSDDLAHDAHLRAALHHAPDHALSPPSGLSQSILAAARQSHRPAQATPAPPPMRMRVAGAPSLRTWLRRMMTPRWAGAWAAALVAALGLGLWLDLELQPVVERPTLEAAVRSTAPAAPPALEAPSAPVPRSNTADEMPAMAKAAQVPVPGERKAAQAQAPSRLKERVAELTRNSDTVAAPTHEPAAAAPPQRDVAQAAPEARVDAAPQAMQGAVAAAREEDKPAADLRVARQARASPPLASTVPPPAAAGDIQQRQEGAARIDTLRQQAARGAAKAEAGSTLAVAAQPSPALALLRRAQGELAAGSARWTWAAPGRPTITPLDDDAQAWLSRVVQSTHGRWVDAGERGESLDALEARWWRDGWPQATLRIEADGVRWVEASSRIRYAPLDAATLQRLRSF